MSTRAVVTLTLSSFALTSIIILHAFHQKTQFYPSVVYLTKSNVSLAVLYAQAFVFVYLIAQLVRRIFFGQLRAVESEHLSERAWYAVTETCLAFTVFRDDFSPRFVAQFALLLVVKCFHWLAEDRVDYMERSPLITVVFHARLMAILGLLSALDSHFVSHAYFSTLLRGASVQIVFGFEYAILMTVIFHVATKYILHSIDSRSIHPWETKAVYLLYAELVVTFVRVILYFTFIMVMIRLHTFPLFSVRPVYITLKAFKKALNDVFMSRRAINYLNTLYPSATEEELAQTDNVCIICREEMRPNQTKKLPCNHIFHASCLRSWFQRQQTCPTCRLDIIQATLATNIQQQPVQQNQPMQPQVPPVIGGQQPMGGFMMMGPPGQLLPPMQPNVPGGGVQPGTSGVPPILNQIGGMPPFPMMMPPMMMPPFPLPFPAPPDLTALTDEEVHQMEQQGRRGVEARILALRNVQTLLDAAVVQLQQYLSIVPTGAVPDPVPVPPSAQTVTKEDKTSAPVNFDLGENGPSTSRDGYSNNETPSYSTPDKQGENPFAALTTNSEEIRQRRLMHFSKSQLSSENNGNAEENSPSSS